MDSSLDELISDVIRRRQDGEVVTDHSIIDAHPHLMPDLAHRLDALRMIGDAFKIARIAPPASPHSSFADPLQIVEITGSSHSTWADADAATRLPSPAIPSDSFAGYQVLREVHRGGQGVVYQAIQNSTRRKVAIKVMHEGPFADTLDRARFDREVQILAHLQHPNIVAVHDSGVAEGRLFFVMDYVSGQPLDVYMAAGRRSIRETLTLFAAICDAVNAAHIRGIIHRDLKPSNIRVDASGAPRVLDFGLAKVSPLDPIADGGAAMTMTGQFIGSLPWASPEQAEAVPGKVDLRTDVYSLGVVLYQMLTGRFPYDVAGNMHDVVGRILKSEPPPPSRLARSTPSVLQGIDDEIDTIALKCLAKERERRYQTAGELARDVHRYLRGEPIEAKRDSTWYVLRKQMRRHRGALLFGAALLLMLIVSSAVAWTLYGLARQRLWSSHIASSKASRQTPLVGRRRESIDAVRAAAAIRADRDVRNEAIAALALYDLEITQERANPDPGSMVRISPNLTYEASWTWHAGSFVVRQAGKDRPILQLEEPRDQPLIPRFSDDERLLARSSGKECEVWDLESVSVISRFTAEIGITSQCDFSSDGRQLAVAGLTGEVYFHDIASQETRTVRISDRRIIFLDFAPGGEVIALSTAGGPNAIIVDIATGEVVSELPHPHWIHATRWSPDGRYLAAGCRDGTIYVWNYASRALAYTLRGHTHEITSLWFSPNGDQVWSESWDGTSRIWDTHRGLPLLTWDQTVLNVSRDGRRFAFERRAPDLFTGVGRVLESEVYHVMNPVFESEFASHGYSVDVSSDGRLAAMAGEGVSLRIWDVARGELLATLPVHHAHSVVFRSSPSELITSSRSSGVLRWPIVRSARALTLGPPQPLTPSGWMCQEAALSADENSLLFSAHGNRLGIIPLSDAEPTPRLIGEPHEVRFVAISPDARCGATSGFNTRTDAEVRVLDLQSGEVVHRVPNPLRTALAFSPDNRWLIVTSARIQIWSVGDWKLCATFPHSGRSGVSNAAFSPDSRMAAFLVNLHRIELIDLADMTSIARLESPDPIGMEAITFSPDGTRIFVPDPTGRSLICWDLRKLRENLAEMDLDWDLPAYPPAAHEPLSDPIEIRVDLGHLK